MHTPAIVGAAFVVACLSAGATAEPTTQPGPTIELCVTPAVRGLKIVSSNWPDTSSLRQLGLDAIRLENAKTDETKALAIWRWVRRLTMATGGVTPIEPGNGYITEPLAILNTYGDHHCDGLSRLMAETWWATTGQPATKAYRSGHTMCDCWWVDADGVGRWHMFDVNYGYFLYSRDGSHIVTCDEIGMDFSLSCLPSKTSRPWIEKQWWMYSAIHSSWVPAGRHDGVLGLHAGERLERHWRGPKDSVYDAGALRSGPEPDGSAYPMTQGAGVQSFAVAFSQPDWESQLAGVPVNATTESGQLRQARPNDPAEFLLRARSPYVVADAAVRLHVVEPGRVCVETSVDRGTTWAPAWAMKVDSPKVLSLRVSDVQPKSQPDGRINRRTPLGRYEYVVRVRLSDGAALASAGLTTWFQHNVLSMPTLIPGENAMTITGELAPGQALEVTHDFDDADAAGKTQVVRAESLPFTYSIPAAGRRWADVATRRVTVQVLPADGKGNRVLKAAPAAKVLPPADKPMTLDLRVLNCITPEALKLQPPALQATLKVSTPAEIEAANNGPFEPTLKSTAEYVKDLTSADEDTRRFAAAGLIVRRDPAAWDALEKVAVADSTRAKYYAVQALFWTDAKRAWPVMEKILKADPAIAFAADKGRTEAPNVRNMCAMVSALAGQAKIKEASPLICAALSRKGDDWNEPQWAMLRALGRIGDPAAIPTLRKFHKQLADTAIVAMESSIALGDREVIPTLVEWLGFKGLSLRPETAMMGLMAFKETGHAGEILPLLAQSSPYRRGIAAEALAVSGQPDVALPALRQALDKETVEFVRTRLVAAIAALDKPGK